MRQNFPKASFLKYSLCWVYDVNIDRSAARKEEAFLIFKSSSVFDVEANRLFVW